MNSETYADDIYAEILNEINDMSKVSHADMGQITFLLICFVTNGFQHQVYLKRRLILCTNCFNNVDNPL